MADVERYLEGKHAVVTGGSRGIGAAVAAELVRRGAKVTIMGRSAETLERQAAGLRGEPGATVAVAECDVSSETSVRAAFAHAIGALGPAYILVNNAGTARSRTFTQTTREVWDEMLAVNLTGTFLCTSEVLPAMIEAKSGRIINIASTAGLRGYRTMSAYCAAKHGVVGMTRTLALETARDGVTVNAVCPSYTDTYLTSLAVNNLITNLGKSSDEALGMLTRTIPRGTLITPEEVAGAVSWLCSPGTSGVTGIMLPIGGEVS
ncbi:MAG TPA: SDR family NAD(P)-dependent oxidoreductase [Gemmatimonadaceae bacterium]|nr:SDR family NAD(P)-dependent oxidoreductase [Gemmatimonadaceae bacterium]